MFGFGCVSVMCFGCMRFSLNHFDNCLKFPLGMVSGHFKPQMQNKTDCEKDSCFKIQGLSFPALGLWIPHNQLGKMFPSRYSYFSHFDRVEPKYFCSYCIQTSTSITWPKFLRVKNCDVLIELGLSSEYNRLPGT